MNWHQKSKARQILAAVFGVNCCAHVGLFLNSLRFACQNQRFSLKNERRYNRGFGPLPPDDRAAINACIEELEALSGQTCQRVLAKASRSILKAMVGKFIAVERYRQCSRSVVWIAYPCSGSGGQDPDALTPKLAGKWRLIWATSPDVLLLTFQP